MYFVQKNKNKREKIEKNCAPFYSFYQWLTKLEAFSAILEAINSKFLGEHARESPYNLLVGRR